MLHVKGNKIFQDESEYTINGISLIDIGEIKQSITKKIDTAVHFWNINTIRLPVYPFSVQGRFSPYPYKPGNGLIADVLVPAVAYADAHDLVTIVDYHQINPLSDVTVAGAVEFWREAIPKLERFDNLIFEVYNEPTNGNAMPPWKSTAAESWALCRPYLHSLVTSVREMTDRMILCPTPVCCRLPMGAEADPLDVLNVAYTAHVYPPDVWSNEGFGEILREHIEFSNAIIDQIKGCKNVPLVLTEVGFNMGNPEFVTAFEGLGKVNWIAWVMDNLWWPPLLNEFGIPSRYGKKVRELMR